MSPIEFELEKKKWIIHVIYEMLMCAQGPKMLQ